MILSVSPAASSRGLRSLAVGLLVVFAVAFGAIGQNWPLCGSETCVAANLEVLGATIVETIPCAGGKRTADVRVNLKSTATAVYFVRLSGEIRYADETVLATFDHCLPSYSGAGWVTVLTGLQWDCDKSLHLQNVLISWQNVSGAYPCGDLMPCSMISPMCRNQGSQEIIISGTAPSNLPPAATDDAATMNRGESVTISILANDTDPEGSALVIDSITSPMHGRVTVVGTDVQYTPEFLYTGTDTFEYTVRDTGGLTATATVTVEIADINAPPVANAGGAYIGLVEEPILLDARFSTDPDLQDTLEYRWDIDSDGEWDTDWTSSPTYEVVFARPYRGSIVVEVRDLYFGRLHGTTAQASSFASIRPKPTQLAISVYVDLNGNREFDEGDVGLPGVSLLLDGDVEFFTGEDGTALLNDVTPGVHTIRISDAGIAFLQERGFFLSEDSLASVELKSGDWVALFFSPEARGFLEVDLGAEEEQ